MKKPSIKDPKEVKEPPAKRLKKISEEEEGEEEGREVGEISKEVGPAQKTPLSRQSSHESTHGEEQESTSSQTSAKTSTKIQSSTPAKTKAKIQTPAKTSTKGKGVKVKEGAKAKPVKTVAKPVEEIEHEEEEEEEEEEEDDSEDDDEENEDEEEEEGSQSQILKKRQCVTLDQEVEEALIDWIKSHRFFYDKSVIDYRKFQEKGDLWAAKAKELGITLKELKKWYLSLRTRFGKLSKTKSGQGAPKVTQREQWILDQFAFLRSHIYRQPSRVSCSVSNFFLS